MTRPQTKIRELLFLNSFLERCGIAPASVTPGESPDFTIELEGRLIGVEMREIVREPAIGLPPHRQQESLRWRLAALATKLWNDRDLPPVHVTMHFNPHYPLHDRRVDSIASS